MKWLLGLAALFAPVAAQATVFEDYQHPNMRIIAESPPHTVATDCPLRDARFSVESPLYDVLLSPAAMAAVERVRPGFAGSIPPFFSSLETPSFATILSFKTVTRFAPGTTEAEIAALDTVLRTVPVTAADRVARCARYDNDRPDLTQTAGQRGRPRVLLFEKMTGFRDGPSVEAAKAMVRNLAQQNGWSLAVTDKGGSINSRDLRRFDVVIWNNVSGDVLTLSQRRALKSWVEHGGGFVAMHGSGGDPTYFWDWYVDSLIGARFTGHPSDPQFQDATVHMERTASGIGSTLPASWSMNEEWYSFAASARLAGAHVIATLDESTYRQAGRFGTNITMGADHPIAWTRCVRNGRSFYSAIGHRPENYSDPHQISMITEAVTWAAGQGASRCRNGTEVSVSRR